MYPIDPSALTRLVVCGRRNTDKPSERADQRGARAWASPSPGFRTGINPAASALLPPLLLHETGRLTRTIRKVGVIPPLIFNSKRFFLFL